MEKQFEEILHSMVNMMAKCDEGKFSKDEMVAYNMGVIHTLEALDLLDDFKRVVEDKMEDVGI